MNTPKVEIFTFPGEENWLACCRRFDIVEQGWTESAAIDALFRNMVATAIVNHREGIEPFSQIGPPPRGKLAEWEQLHRECHRKNNQTRKTT